MNTNKANVIKGMKLSLILVVLAVNAITPAMANNHWSGGNISPGGNGFGHGMNSGHQMNPGWNNHSFQNNYNGYNGYNNFHHNGFAFHHNFGQTGFIHNSQDNFGNSNDGAIVVQQAAPFITREDLLRLQKGNAQISTGNASNSVKTYSW